MRIKIIHKKYKKKYKATKIQNKVYLLCAKLLVNYYCVW